MYIVCVNAMVHAHYGAAPISQEPRTYSVCNCRNLDQHRRAIRAGREAMMRAWRFLDIPLAKRLVRCLEPSS
jgi:hypothetical protein